MKLTQVSKYHWVNDDKTIEVIIRQTGRKVRENKFGGGTWHFSSKHADMMPHEATFSIFINNEVKARDVFEEDIRQNLKNLGFQT